MPSRYREEISLSSYSRLLTERGRTWFCWLPVSVVSEAFSVFEIILATSKLNQFSFLSSYCSVTFHLFILRSFHIDLVGLSSIKCLQELIRSLYLSLSRKFQSVSFALYCL